MIGVSLLLIANADSGKYSTYSGGQTNRETNYWAENRQIWSTDVDQRTGSDSIEHVHSRQEIWSWDKQEQGVVEEVSKGSTRTDHKGTESVLRVEGFPLDSDATKIINYAYEISNGDMDFVLTLKAENGWFDIYKQSNVYDEYGPNNREDSRGLCQLHRRWHSDIVDQPKFRDWYEYQVDACYEKYVGWTRFYGYDVRERYRHLFYRE